jgi:hypothetical protein
MQNPVRSHQLDDFPLLREIPRYERTIYAPGRIQEVFHKFEVRAISVLVAENRSLDVALLMLQSGKLPLVDLARDRLIKGVPVLLLVCVRFLEDFSENRIFILVKLYSLELPSDSSCDVRFAKVGLVAGVRAALRLRASGSIFWSSRAVSQAAANLCKGTGRDGEGSCRCLWAGSTRRRCWCVEKTGDCR